MRTLKALLASCILVMALSMPAFAGNISTPGVIELPPPPPPPGFVSEGGLIEILLPLLAWF
jgi:hypothetical protein